MEQLIIYFWSISENITFLLGFLGTILITSGFFILLSLLGEKGKEREISACIIAIISAVVLFFISLLIPSKRDLALILAYPYLKTGAQQIVESEVAGKLTTISNKYLDGIIEDLLAKQE